MGRSKQLRARNEIKELREENRQLRELVAHCRSCGVNSNYPKQPNLENRWLVLKVPHA
jgi:transposase-like protein